MEIELADELFDSGWAHLRMADVEAAMADFQRCKEVYEKAGDVVGAADVDDAIGLTLCHLDRQRDAFDLHIRAYAVFVEHEIPACAEHAAANAAWAAMEGGDADLAVHWAERALDAAVSDDGADDFSTRLVHARALIAAGRVDQAEQIAADAPAAIEGVDGAFLDRVFAAVHSARGENDEAADHYERAIERYIRCGDFLEARCTQREMRAGY